MESASTFLGITTHPKFLRRYYAAFMRWSVRGSVRRAIMEHRPDAILSYWAHPDGAVAVQAAHQAGLPALIIVGGSDVLMLSRDPSRHCAIRKVLHEADGIVAVSRDLQARVIEFGVSPEKVHVVYRGVDLQRFAPDTVANSRAVARARLGISDNRPVLLWVGRMESVKGLDVLLDACAIVRRQNIAFRLQLVGDGGLRSSLTARVAELGLQDHVFFAGSVPNDRLPDHYRAANVTVLPSHSEGRSERVA